jgi:hypothetical protein
VIKREEKGCTATAKGAKAQRELLLFLMILQECINTARSVKENYLLLRSTFIAIILEKEVSTVNVRHVKKLINKNQR